MKSTLSKPIKYLLFHAAIYLAMFNMVPFGFAQGSGQGITAYVSYGLPAVCTILSAAFVKTVGIKLYYFLVAPLCFIPSIYIFYGESGYLYLAVLLIFTLVGTVVGVLLRKFTPEERSQILKNKRLK